MKTREEIEAELAKVEADERLGYPAAHIEVNAPLAIIQIDLKERARALRWVLDLPQRQYHSRDKEETDV